MGRSPCCDESGLKKGPWTPEEDEILVNYIKKHGHGSWRALPKLAGLNRCGKSCRLRWTNYLRPDIKRGKFSPEEEKTILNLHAVLGNKWSAIAGHLPGRTDNEIKNYWNTHLKKRLINSGIDPMTHRPRTDIFSSLPHLLALVNLKELMDHHSLEEHALRIQAEAMAKLQYLQSLLQTPPTSSVAIPSPNTSNNHINGLTDMETLKLLSSLPQQEASCVSPTFGSLSHNTLRGGCFSFPRLPELQNPCSFPSTLSKDNSMIQAQVPESAVISQAEDSLNFHWQPSKSPKSSPQLLVDDAPDAAAITNRHGDPCITSSLDGVSCSSWPDILLEDPSFSSLLS